MADKEPDPAPSAEEPAATSADADAPQVGSYEYIQRILDQNRKRNAAAGGNKNGH